MRAYEFFYGLAGVAAVTTIVAIGLNEYFSSRTETFAWLGLMLVSLVVTLVALAAGALARVVELIRAGKQRDP